VADPRFYSQAGPLSVATLCELTGAELATPDLADRALTGVAPIAGAGPEDITFLQGKKHKASLGESRAGACFVAKGLEDAAPEGMAVLIVPDAQRAFADAISAFHPEREGAGVHPGAHVAETAKLEDGVSIGAGAVVGAKAEIGEGTFIAPGAVVGPGVTIGRDCFIGANVSLEKALIGNRVRIYAGAVIGTDGFGYAMGLDGHKKIPQVGRVIIQDDVEVGACTTIDRGALDDTVIGEGTKIDNLVQIGHNCRIGRNCVIVGMVGLSGSTILEDFVVLGGQVGSAGHVTIGAGSMVAARSGIKDDLPPGGVYGGAPAKPVKEWMREIAAVSLLAKRGADKKKK
jgi:UDP-3-O-[3-hydroxymyristoyl] glucosamine N-acyltransferase